MLPDDLLWVENPDSGNPEQIVSGTLRTGDVQVGSHIAVSPGALPRFMKRFENAYQKPGRVSWSVCPCKISQLFDYCSIDRGTLAQTRRTQSLVALQ